MDSLVTLLTATFFLSFFALIALLLRNQFIIEMLEFIGAHLRIIQVFYRAWPFIFSSTFRRYVYDEYEGIRFLWIIEALAVTIIFLLECLVIFYFSFWLASKLLGGS